MSSPGLEMSLERLPDFINKTQMNGESGGGRSQCGLGSLLPMSCRGRAVAFARDLHSRLRSLGTQDDDDEGSWLSQGATTNNTSPLQTSINNNKEHDAFYDFEIECESPSSPVEEYDLPFPEPSHIDSQEPKFYDAELDFKKQTKNKSQQPEKSRCNGFNFTTTIYTENSSPIKLQPVPRENGLKDKQLYSPITFEGCARQNSQDEVDFRNHTLSSADETQSNLPVDNVNDSDSEFESAKSDQFEVNENQNKIEQLVDSQDANTPDGLSISEDEVPATKEQSPEKEITTKNLSLEIITSEIPGEWESSPAREVDETLLTAEVKTDNQDQEEDDKPQRVRRCSSLKTGKTPPGTPGRKKIVRFADVLGLDLADVKTFMDEIPVIPKSAYDDLTGCDLTQNSPPVRSPQRFGALTLVPLFQVPRDVTDKLERQNVCLESAKVGDGIHLTISGSVRVRNLDFHKTVHIRYTMNRWKTFTDLQATYVQGTCDGYSDRFQFLLYVPSIVSGQRLELAVRFQCKGQQFWDNYSGINYCFDCLALGTTPYMPSPLSTNPLHPTGEWCPSFY